MYQMRGLIFILFKYTIYMMKLYERQIICLKFKLKIKLKFI
jgi:hypothetical protein